MTDPLDETQAMLRRLDDRVRELVDQGLSQAEAHIVALEEEKRRIDQEFDDKLRRLNSGRSQER